MPANFNTIAPVYDQLSFLVYGKKLIDAKEAFLDLIPENSRILLMGGGTGNILNDLLTKKLSAIIDYIEPSERMVSIAKKNLKNDFKSKVNFICGDEHSIPEGVQYNVCTSFFVMDCFTQQHALEFARKITSQVIPEGMWLFADFFWTGKASHRMLIHFMYRFFKIVSNIETNILPEYEKIFQKCGFTQTMEKPFMNGLVKSLVLKRN